MKFCLTCEVTTLETWEVEAASFEAACREYGRLRADCEPPDDGDVKNSELYEVADDHRVYDLNEAEKLIP
jgi:hypothetical protein